MTITTQPARNEYTANAGQTVFNYTFKIFSNTDLNVYVTPAGADYDDSLYLTTDYVVDPAGIGNEDGGFITLGTPTNQNDLVTIVTDVPSNREIDYQNNGDFRPVTVNADFDRVVSIAKKVEDLGNRAALLPQSQQGPKPISLPNPESGKLIKWNGSEDGFDNVTFPEILPPGSIIDNVSNVNYVDNPQFAVRTPDPSVTPPDNTPRSYNVGDQIFSGWFAGTAITDLTYNTATGVINAASGTIYQDISRVGALEFVSSFIASTSKSDLIPIEDGSSFSTNGEFIRVEIDLSQLTDTLSSKLEVGIIPTNHEPAGDIAVIEYGTVAEMVSNPPSLNSKVKTYFFNTEVVCDWVVKQSSSLFFVTLDNGLVAELQNNDNFINIKKLGADGTQSNDTVAFYEGIDKYGFIDCAGLSLNIEVTAQTSINKKIHIKNGSGLFSAATALRVFIWESGDLFRLEDFHVTGNSNGTIDDSFDATSGTIAFIRAELTVDGAARNLEIERSSFKQTIPVEDNKNAVTSATAFRVIGGYIRNSYFENIPGHAFSSNSYVGIKITQNIYKNVGALCVDFGALTSDCIFENNEIDGASGIGKTQNRFNSGELILPQNNSISFNEAKNLTSGNGDNVAVIKLTGRNDNCERNRVIYAGGANVDSIEVFGSANVVRNEITRTTDLSRNYITTVTDPNLSGVVDNPVINIVGNKGNGMLNFVVLQNTSPARVTISENRPDNLSKFLFGGASLNLPGLKILDNEYDSSANVGPGMLFASSVVSLARMKVHGNTCKSEGTGLVAYNAEGATLTGNSFEHATGNNFDIITTASYAVVGNSANAAWPATSSQQIVENNTVF